MICLIYTRGWLYSRFTTTIHSEDPLLFFGGYSRIFSVRTIFCTTSLNNRFQIQLSQQIPLIHLKVLMCFQEEALIPINRWVTSEVSSPGSSEVKERWCWALHFQRREPCVTLHLKAVPYLKWKEKRIARLLQVRSKEIKFTSLLLLLSRNLHSSKPRGLQASLATRLSFPQNFKNEMESPCVSTASTVKTNRVCMHFCCNSSMLVL